MTTDDTLPAETEEGTNTPEFLQELLPETKKTIRKFLAVCQAGGLAKNSFKALFADGAIFTSWCRAANRFWLPADPETIVDFINAMAATRSPATVTRYVSSISTWHRAARFISPTTDELVIKSLKAIRSKRVKRQRQAAPIGEAELVEIGSVLGESAASADETERLIALRDYALTMMAYRANCRASELVNFLTLDLTVNREGSGTILKRFSKTDREGEGSIKWLDPETIAAIGAWLQARDTAFNRHVEEEQLRQEGINSKRFPRLRWPQGRPRTKRRALAVPLEWRATPYIFRGLSPHYEYRTIILPNGTEERQLVHALGWSLQMHPDTVSRIVKRLAGEIGRDASLYSGHSMRVGKTQDLLAGGADLFGTMQDGDWKTPTMPARYGEHILAARGASAQLYHRREAEKAQKDESETE